jgi:hypothetical protein
VNAWNSQGRITIVSVLAVPSAIVFGYRGYNEGRAIIISMSQHIRAPLDQLFPSADPSLMRCVA